MRQRPVLSNEIRLCLEEVFNQDLIRLGDWLGINLNCDNFKESTTKRTLNWVGINDQ